jgi:hypothetical protein
MIVSQGEALQADLVQIPRKMLVRIRRIFPGNPMQLPTSGAAKSPTIARASFGAIA